MEDIPARCPEMNRIVERANNFGKEYWVHHCFGLIFLNRIEQWRTTPFVCRIEFCPCLKKQSYHSFVIIIINIETLISSKR